ncbi:hypothetical protein Xen7305DRAFT_00001050 [Xenococcus sp. PCC 7305]|uniref:COP23 domain-containing protein n=1 Tax=Xenococcus sp. PCC 7305 TaxID=102125 RepID=UPI0002AC80E8|nr:COP23 domain-containing protein [Xenococcus sp. PCC 7305]ELS00404.1 hypothetical protein Xen7305DRAFT_00001050 [Xenococcus sp. PCC 7305]
MMQFSPPAKIITAVTVGASILTISLSLQASSDKYSCREVDGVHGIYSRTVRGYMRLLNFKRDINPDWSIENRCEAVSKRFQRFSDNDILKFIGSGYVNQEPVLCAVAEKGQLCNATNVLVTLPPQSDPIEAARKLMDTRGLARGNVIDVSGQEGKLESYIDGKAYYDIAVLEQLILEQESSDRIIKDE